MAKKSTDVRKISPAHLERLHELNAKIRGIIEKVGTLELDITTVNKRQEDLQRESKSHKDAWLNVIKDRNDYAEELRKEYGNDIAIDQTTGEISDARESRE